MTRYSAAAAMLFAAAVASAADWSSPFDGKTLNGWKAEGNAAWSVEKGELVGRQGPGGAAGDLFSVPRWRDFELEAEWTMRFPGNSGIWFRVAGANTGYQADILEEASYPGVLSGSLYCMGKAFIAENRDASTVKRDGWNRVRIRAAGDELTIVQNGKEVVRVRDGTFPGAGSIGIQVHAGKQFEGMEVRIRNLRVRNLD
jgi:hypothetical protein